MLCIGQGLVSADVKSDPLRRLLAPENCVHEWNAFLA